MGEHWGKEGSGLGPKPCKQKAREKDYESGWIELDCCMSYTKEKGRGYNRKPECRLFPAPHVNGDLLGLLL